MSNAAAGVAAYFLSSSHKELGISPVTCDSEGFRPRDPLRAPLC